MQSQIAALLLLFVASAWSKILYAGVNESGGEFGVYVANGTIQGLPGEFGVSYQFINKSTVDIYAQQNNINFFRVPFLLERMCPLQYGLGSKFNETYFSEYQDAINHITVTNGAYALLDPHNYMRYNNPSMQPTSGSVIGNTSDPKAATTAQFKSFWNELAGRFKSNNKVVFGIMNEPHDMPTKLVFQNDQAAIDGIRAAGAKQLILAPGNSYTGGHVWLQRSGGPLGKKYAPSGNYLYKLKDKLENTAIDVHEYLDYDFSGGHRVCNESGPANLQGLTAWLKEHKLKAVLSEFGGDNTTSCDHLVPGLLKYLQNNDEWIGWTAWAAGPLWGQNAPCCSDGVPLGSLEPNVPAGGGGPPLYETVWLPLIQPHVPSTLKRSGVSSVK